MNMPRVGSKMSVQSVPSKQRSNMLRILGQLYPNPQSELNFCNEYELLVSVMLSAQCTDKKVNQVTPLLFQRFADFKALSRANLNSLEAIIRPINYYRTKARALISTAKNITQNFDGKVPRTMQELITLNGVGQKTANVVLNELKIEATLPVDTHVFRLSKRLGFSNAKNPKELEEDLKKVFKSSLWRDLHHWLILHGRRVCKARNPACEKCELNKLCPASTIN